MQASNPLLTSAQSEPAYYSDSSLKSNIHYEYLKKNADGVYVPCFNKVFEVRKQDNTHGYALYTFRYIDPKDDLLIYYSEIQSSAKVDLSQYGDVGIKVGSQRVGGVDRLGPAVFVQHAYGQSPLVNIKFTPYAPSKDVAYANTLQYEYENKLYFRVYKQALPAGVLLTYDYSHRWWETRKRIPSFFSPTGDVVTTAYRADPFSTSVTMKSINDEPVQSDSQRELQYKMLFSTFSDCHFDMFDYVTLKLVWFLSKSRSQQITKSDVNHTKTQYLLSVDKFLRDTIVEHYLKKVNSDKISSDVSLNKLFFLDFMGPVVTELRASLVDYMLTALVDNIKNSSEVKEFYGNKKTHNAVSFFYSNLPKRPYVRNVLSKSNSEGIVKDLADVCFN